jgi:hypothetical protein
MLQELVCPSHQPSWLIPVAELRTAKINFTEMKGSERRFETSARGFRDAREKG